MHIIFKRYPLVTFLLLSTFICSLLFLTANYRHYPFSGFLGFMAVFAHWSLSAAGLFVLMVVLSLNRYLFLFTFPPISLIAAVTAYFTWQLDISINPALVESLSLTNTEETLSYLSAPLILIIAGTLLFAAALILYRFRIKAKKSELLPLLSLTIICLLVFVYVNKTRKGTLMMRSPFVYYVAYKNYKEDVEEMQRDRVLLGKGAFAESDSLITLFIIGEALRADHIQMNGYHRITMPRMEKRKALFLPHVFSPHTYTAASLRYVLTRAAPGLEDPIYSESSFIDLFKQSAFHTAWIANQNPITPLLFFIQECDTVHFNKPHISDYSNMPKYDSDLIEPFVNLIGQNNPRQLAILHLSGNHWYYNKNLPKEFARFTPILENKILSTENKERMINSYDDVTLFVDSVIDQMIQAVEDKEALVIFLSDHGQSFGENGKWLHANDMPAEQNPACFVWYSHKYEQHHPAKVAQLKNNLQKEVDTAFLFHTILDGSTIHSPSIEASRSLFSSEFQPKMEGNVSGGE
jgi:glucan phosphoethanolaminetransferase (alkaline phosphatase superfamily)